MLAACLCCRKKVPKNELLGLEGMVKLKNPDDIVHVAATPTRTNSDDLTVSADSKVSASVSFENEKRVSNAPHRSLPDIPISEPLHATASTLGVIAQNGGGAGGTGADNGSDLYATVGDKTQSDKEQLDRRLQASNIRKLASISQHSSISQADDVSSPYARVKSITNHAYDKLRTAEHPYAQVTAVGPSGNAVAAVGAVAAAAGSAPNAGTSSSTAANNGANRPSGDGAGAGGDVHQQLLLLQQQRSQSSAGGDAPGLSRHGSGESLLGEAIGAASAIAGRVSASQELPYMTPPIVQQSHHHNNAYHHHQAQHFSGDSQDSSKGYTSISVREPLASIMAQTQNQQQQQQQHNQQHQQQHAQINAMQRRRDMTDSHYATVSDDSDEMYAAIEDPNSHAELYTSGSETYAQIQPPAPTLPPPPISAPLLQQQHHHQAAALGAMATNSAAAVAAVSVVPITVAVEINSAAARQSASSLTPLGRLSALEEDVMSSLNSISSKHQNVASAAANTITVVTVTDETHHPNAGPAAPLPPPVDSLRTVIHSRQASSSSCNSSVGNLGSPKPEKRQANSPLPPTPKSSASTTASGSGSGNHSSLTIGSAAASLPSSSRNSVGSVIECMPHPQPAGGGGGGGFANSRHVSRENLPSTGDTQTRSQSRLSVSALDAKAHDDEAHGSASKKRNSAKNLEGMYAKVMKKNKLSNAPSQNTSPVPYRKSYSDVAHLQHAQHGPSATLPAVPTVDNVTSALSRSMRLSISSSCTTTNEYEAMPKDPEYETIPADAALNASAALAASAQLARTAAVGGAGLMGTATAAAAAGLLAQGIQRVSHNSINIFNEMANSTAPPPAIGNIPWTRNGDATTAVDDEEPGYESLPDQRSVRSDAADPGYETLHGSSKTASSSIGIGPNEKTTTLSVKLQRNASASDYDPNYEVLRHNNNNNNNNILTAPPYAKLSQAPSATAAFIRPLDDTDERQSNDGYSSIPPAVPADNAHKTAAADHDYAQIGERSNARTFVLGPDTRIERRAIDGTANDASELYSSIQTADAVRLSSSSDPNYSTISETTTSATAAASSGIVAAVVPIIATPTTPPSEAASPTAIEYASMRTSLGSSGTATNSTSSNSSSSSVTPTRPYTTITNTTTTTADTITPLTTPTSLKSTTSTTAATTPASPSDCAAAVVAISASSTADDVGAIGGPMTPQHNYDSLTGSESDPNYESVRYSTKQPENPYERLYGKEDEDARPRPPTAHVPPIVDDYFHV